jgi:hypothetical protein
VTALVYPYVAPFLVLLAMDRQRAGAVQPERSDDGRPAAEPTASAAAVT